MEGRLYNFIQIVNVSEAFPKRITQTFQVRSITTDVNLGWIQWNSGWRCYCFFPEENTFYETVCLNNIVGFLEELKKERLEMEK
jgi:hypothetical protein